MKKNLTLVVLAGGMGSRFGGLKQIEPVGPNGEIIMDYSIFDAVRAGFNKVVIVIKKENLEIFREKIGNRIEKVVDVKYAFQELDDIPKGFKVPEGRTKPWGTGQALLSAKEYVDGDMMMINADDFYGYESYVLAKEFFEKNSSDYGLIGYKVNNTLSKNGSAKRGICEVENNYLTNIIESSVIEENGVITATPLEEEKGFEVKDNQTVSMNMFCFKNDIFKYLEDAFLEFFKEGKDLEKRELLIPSVVKKLIDEGKKKVRVVPTNAKWYGITYKEDKPELVEYINKLTKEEKYPQDLWK